MKQHRLFTSIEHVLMQGIELLEAVNSDEYNTMFEGPPAATIGGHYRHVLDHFESLLRGIRTGEVDYDRRERSREIETSRIAAMRATEALLREFREMGPGVLDWDAVVVSSVDYEHYDATTVCSNVAREIMYCTGHAIHHFAIVKLMCSFRSIQLPTEFGVAPSTLKHMATQMAS